MRKRKSSSVWCNTEHYSTVHDLGISILFFIFTRKKKTIVPVTTKAPC